MRLSCLVPALVLVGCANSGDEGMIVLNNTALAGDSCALTGDSSQAFLPHGMIDYQSDIGYVMTPLVQSRVTERIGGGSGAQTGSADTNARTILFRGADIQLTVKSTQIEQGGVYMTNPAERTLPAFSALFSGSVPPNGTANVIFEAITAGQLRDIMANSGGNPMTQNIRVEVLAEVTIKGTLGGDDVSSSPFYYPITVCNDCIVKACPDGVESALNPCNALQDGLFCL